MTQIRKDSLFTAIQSNNSNIQNYLLERKQIVDALRLKIISQQQIDNQYTNKITNHCQQYNKIKDYLIDIPKLSNRNPIEDNNKFWQLNQNLQRNLQQKLRNLKNIDITIDNIVNQQFDKCNQMDQIQQTIRSILNKKQNNHIQKAQPYYLEKQRCLEFLKLKKIQKQKIKQHKTKAIKDILYLLHQLKNHRESRLKYCTQKNIDTNTGKLLQNFINDLQQIIRSKQSHNSIQANQKKLFYQLEEINQKLDKNNNELIQNMNQQIKILVSLDNVSKDKYRINYFQKNILKFLDKDVHQKQLSDLYHKYQNYLRTQSQKGKQAQRIHQGINTTTDTIQIFGHILDKIESENARKKSLLSKIQKLQEKHKKQAINQQQIAQFQSEIQRTQIRKHRLEKTLAAKVDQADVSAYKSIHLEIQNLQKELLKSSNRLEQIKLQSRENAKILYNQTNHMQEDYRDILNQTVPSVWFRDKDFTKQQTVRDLNLYLIKTFKRLSVVD